MREKDEKYYIDGTEVDTTEITDESIKSFLKTHSGRIINIATAVHKKMDNIAQKMANIQIYMKDSEKQNKEVYEPIMDQIKDYFNYVQNSVQDFPTTDPLLINVIKYQLYKTIFSLNKSKPLELLFCAQTLDADLFLACSRRANLCKQDNKKRDLILCDMNMCRDFIELGVLIKNVVNVGIMHHYIPVNLDQVLDESSNTKIFFDKEVKQAVLDVSKLIPNFIKKCLLKTENNLKVVLRSCYGVELNGEGNIPELKATKAYPLTIVQHQSPLDEENDINSRRNSALKGHIVIQQVIRNGLCETKLYPPIEGVAPILLENFPLLSNAVNFDLFAKKLINLWSTLDMGLHINPYSIHIYPQLSEYGSSLRHQYTQGLKNFKTVLINTLVEWEEGITKLNSPKKKYNSLFTTTTNLKATDMPEGSYGALLLNLIKECPYVALFKAYYADYRSGPDRTILEMDAKGKNASSPKSLIVSRDTMWNQNKLTNGNSSVNGNSSINNNEENNFSSSITSCSV